MLANESPDGLVAVTPVAATAELAARILSHRIPVLIEKPPGATSAENRRLVGLAARSGTPHMVSYNRRFNPALMRAHNWLQDAAGRREVRFLAARMLRSSRREAAFVTQTAIHLIDTAQLFLGPATAPSTQWFGRLPAAPVVCGSAVSRAPAGRAPAC